MKKILISIVLLLTFVQPSFSAGSSGDSGNSETNYEKALKHIKQAKRFEKKDKIDKAQARYKKAQKLLLKSNKEIPNKANTQLFRFYYLES